MSRRAASSFCGPHTLSRSTRPLASTAWLLPSSSLREVFSLPCTAEAAAALAAVDHVNEAEAAADDEGAAEQRLHLFRRGVRRDVEVLGLEVDQQVAHGAADDVGLVAGVLQLLADVDRRLDDQARIDLVLVDAVLDALAERDARGHPFVGGGRLAPQSVDESANHSKRLRNRQPRSVATGSSAA